jgi:hypothetical protein
VPRCTPAQAAATHEYLGRFTDFGANPPAALAAVFARCCLATHPDFGLDAEAAGAEAGGLAMAALGHTDRARLDLDPLLLVSCQGVLADAGTRVPALGEMLAEAARALAGLEGPVRQVGRVRHVAALLAARGYEVRAAPAAKEVRELIGAPARILNAPAEVVADLADHLFADGAELGEDLTVMLGLTALGEMRNYRVDLGAKLLRLAVAHGTPCEEVEEGLDFVALQRRRGGAYGFTNPFLVPEGGADEMETGYFLPMTLNAAWLFHAAAAARVRREPAGAGSAR